MIYWVSASGPAASIHIYFEVIQEFRDAAVLNSYVKVPFGMSLFPKEVLPFPLPYVYCNQVESSPQIR
jgi:hypothetical protein